MPNWSHKFGISRNVTGVLKNKLGIRAYKMRQFQLVSMDAMKDRVSCYEIIEQWLATGLH